MTRFLMSFLFNIQHSTENPFKMSSKQPIFLWKIKNQNAQNVLAVTYFIQRFGSAILRHLLSLWRLYPVGGYAMDLMHYRPMVELLVT